MANEALGCSVELLPTPLIPPFAEGEANRLRGLLKMVDGTLQGADKVGTVRDMRFVFLDNDTKLLFATAYDGEWDAYIEDFATKIPGFQVTWTCFFPVSKVFRGFVNRL